MKTYLYRGPVSGATLGDGTTVRLHPDTLVCLPETHDYVMALIAQGYLTEYTAVQPQMTVNKVSPAQADRAVAKETSKPKTTVIKE